MLEREVAIKALRPELGSQPQVVERFRSEAVTLAKLNHPNIATLYSFFRQGEDFYMVLEYVRGVTLDHVIQQRGSVPPEQAIPLFCQVLDGIDHAHRFGIIHRDIKPANMMLTPEGILKVLDFGIARILGTARMTKQGHLIGTIEYMAPEQVRGMETDARSDIYSLGMLLYEILTGRPPFQIENEFELMKAQIEQTPLAPRQLNPGIPEAVEGAIMRALAKNPDHRFQTAGDFRAVLLEAGYVASARLTDPNIIGAAANYATRPLSHSSASNPPYSNPSISQRLANEEQTAFLAPPNSTPPPPASGEAAARGLETVAGVSSAYTQPPTETDVSLKETRLGALSADARAVAAPSNQLKETRLGSSPSIQPPPHAAPHAVAASNQSFFSKLTWMHYAGAGVVALVILGVIVTVPLVLYFAGGKKTPATPAAEAEQQQQQNAAPPSVTSEAPPPPTVPAAANPSAPTGSSVSGNDLPNATQQPVTAPPLLTTEQPVSLPTVQPAGAETPAAAQTRKAPKPAAKPRADGAEAARRKRDAALRALDQ
jgi:serine/threonine-protein kinase